MSNQGKQAIVIFCGIPVAARPISQRVGVFASYLAEHGWDVRLCAVDERFDGSPFTVHDPVSGMDVEVIGKAHYQVDPIGAHRTLSPLAYLTECRAISGRMAQIASEIAADHIVLSTTMPASLVAGVRLRRQFPSVWMDIDDWTSGQFVAGGGGRVAGLAYSALERLLPHFAHHVTVCSKYLSRHYPKAILVPNFIRERDIAQRPRHPAASSPVKIAFAGTLTGYYGHAELLETLVARRAELGGLRLTVLGDGPAMEACQAIVKEGGIENIVHFSGQLRRSEMMTELARSDIGILPLSKRRHDRARFPLKLLDYLASGCAIAATDFGMAHEILTHERTGLLSRVGSMNGLVDDVLRLAKDPDLRERLANEGLCLVRQFEADVVCKDWMGAISSSSRPVGSTSRL